MKSIFVIAAMFLLSAFSSPPKSIYEISFKTIDGIKVNMRQLQGRKIMVILLPVDQKDTSYMTQLRTFYAKHKNDVAIIGVLSIEHGYKDEEKRSVKSLIDGNERLEIFITEAMLTKKSAGGNQSELLQWLTNKENNKHFNMDVQGVGQKFFIDEIGDLYGVIGPRSPLSAPVIERILSKPAKRI